MNIIRIIEFLNKQGTHKKNLGRSGFTLIEVIISLTITAVVGVFLVSFLQPQLRIYQKVTVQNSAKTACDGTFNEVQQMLYNGKNFVLNGNVFTYTLVRKEEELPGQTIDGETIGDKYFPNIKKSGGKILTTFAIKGEFVTVTVSVTEEAKALYQITQTIKCPNVALKTE